MEESVSFRSMTESLSTQEFNQFTNTLFTTFDQRELLIKSIFHLLAYQNRNALKTKYTKNINKILINIIHSRNNNTNNDNQQDEDDDIDIDTTNNNKTSISDIPYPLIAEFSSYLDTKEVINYQICNRHIYISCRKHTKSMTKLALNNASNDWFEPYINNNFGSFESRIKHLTQFNMVKNLELFASHFKEITNNNKNPENFVWKNLNKLDIDDLEDIGSWLNANAGILKSQPKLEYLSFYVYYVSNVSHLLSLMSINENIKFLNMRSSNRLCRNQETQSVQNEIIKQFDFVNNMKNLRGITMKDKLHVDDTVFFNVFLQKLSVQLQSYHITSDHLDDHESAANYHSIWNQFGTNYKFDNLKEICIKIEIVEENNDCSELLRSFLVNQTFNKCNLERINLSLTSTRMGGNASFDPDEQSTFISFIEHMLDTQNSLKYLAISGDDGTILNAICNYIRDKLKNNNNNPIFESMKIKFLKWTLLMGNDNRQNIENWLFALIHLMNKAVSGDFLVKCSFPWKKKERCHREDFDETNYWKCIQRMKSLNDIYNLDKTEQNCFKATKYIVTNKNADFYGGYHEKWYMDCFHCH